MRKILFTIYVLLCGIYSNAQVSVNLSELIGTVWTIDGEDKIGEDTTTYYKDYMLNVAYYNLFNKTTRFTTPYYLSEDIPKTFDHSKVGTYSYGCFLVEYNDKLDRMTILQIRSFDLQKGEMVFYNPYIKDAIRDGTIRCRLISKNEETLKGDDATIENQNKENTESQAEEEIPVNVAETIINSLKQMMPD